VPIDWQNTDQREEQAMDVFAIGTPVTWIDGTHTVRTGVVVSSPTSNGRQAVLDDRNGIILHPCDMRFPLRELAE
jgi:hypothetical protein